MLLITASLFSCKQDGPSESVETILTHEEQQRYTPDEVLRSLLEGNERFMKDSLTHRLHSRQLRLAAAGQYPKAVILSCVDSRIPVEDVFDKGIGDLFVARIAGNVVNDDIVGSLEFACAVSGAKLILVLGHQECGAVKAAIDSVHIGNINSLVRKIHPSIRHLSQVAFNGGKTSKNRAYVDEVSTTNVRFAIEDIRRQSKILTALEESGQIQIKGAYYNIETGEVALLN